MSSIPKISGFLTSALLGLSCSADFSYFDNFAYDQFDTEFFEHTDDLAGLLNENSLIAYYGMREMPGIYNNSPLQLDEYTMIKEHYHIERWVKATMLIHLYYQLAFEGYEKYGDWRDSVKYPE